tara:strand:- start:32 stop:337 length:306 start_codon:yes stop_codon:yes gene_type:complete
MSRIKGILTNILILVGVFGLLVVTAGCSTVSGVGQDIKDASEWTRDALSEDDNADISEPHSSLPAEEEATPTEFEFEPVDTTPVEKTPISLNSDHDDWITE